jgi:phosphoglycolate phosphatase
MRRVDLAVFDLDNTLYDWYASFIPAFYAMVEVAASALDCDREMLLDQLRAIHRRHHDVEHPFSLSETAIVQSVVRTIGAEETRRKIDPAFHAFNKVRKDNLVLFPDVRTTLDRLHLRRIRLVAFTDSSYFSTLRRIQVLGLSDTFERVFCRARSESENTQPVHFEEGDRSSIIVELPADEAKPDPRVLIDIAKEEDLPLSSIAYIGDSVTKDILMAKHAGCFAIWAKYGVHRDPTVYEKLVRISHWTEDDIRREKNFAIEARTIQADFVCEHSLSEVLAVLSGPVESTNKTDLTARR